MTGVSLQRGFVIRTSFDSNLVPFGWMGAGGCFIVWACALFVSIGGKSRELTELFEPSWGPYIAVKIYFVAVLLTEFKERA